MSIADLVAASKGTGAPQKAAGSQPVSGISALLKASKAPPAITDVPAPVQPMPAPKPTPPAPVPKAAPESIWGKITDVAEHFISTAAGMVGVTQETSKANNTMTFSVGENLPQAQKKAAYDTINKLIAPLPETDDNSAFKAPITVKLPGVDAGFQNVPDNLLNEAVKGIVEMPEIAARDLTQAAQEIFTGKYTETPVSTFTGPGSMSTGIEQTMQFRDYLDRTTTFTPLQSQWISTLYGSGIGILDVAGLGDILASGVKKLATQTAIDSTELNTARALLGNPKDITTAETSFKNIQKISHPDIGGSAKLSTQANNAIAIIRKADAEGMLGKAARVAQKANQPLSDLFAGKAVTKPITAGELPAAGETGKAPAPADGEVPTPKEGEAPTPAEGKVVGPSGVEVPTEEKVLPVKPMENPKGMINPGAAGQDLGKVINSTKQFLEETKKTGVMGKTVSDVYHNKTGSSDADKLAARKMIQNSPMTSQQAENIYHYDENAKGNTLTPDEQKLYDTEIKPLNKKITEIRNFIAQMQHDLPISPGDMYVDPSGNFTERFVVGKGGVMDLLKEARGSVGGSGKSLSKTAPTLKKRTIWALVDSKGNRTIGSIKKGRVTQYENKKATQLGSLDLKRQEEFLKKEVKPLEKKIKRIQTLIDTMKSIKTRPAVSPKKLDEMDMQISALQEYLDRRAEDARYQPEIYKTMTKDIESTREKISKLESRLQTLQKFEDLPKVSKEVEKLSNDITEAYNKEANLSLSDIYEKLSDFTEQKDILDAKTIKELDKTKAEFKILSKIPKEESLVKTKTRIANAEKKLVRLVNQISDIEAKYDPANLQEKVFEGKTPIKDEKTGKTTWQKTGEKYHIEQATTKEIEQHTDLKYHKNILANKLTTYLQLRDVQRNIEALDLLKNMPEFENFTMKQGTGTPPKGWRTTTVPQFRGLYLHPNFAKNLDYFFGTVPSDTGALDAINKSLEAVNHAVRTFNLLNPLIHPKNVAYNYTVWRGASSLVPGMGGYEHLVKSFSDAWDGVMNQTPEFMEMLRNGAAFQSHKSDVKELSKMVALKLNSELANGSELSQKIAESLGYDTPSKIIKFLPHMSEAATWNSNDIFLYSAIKEEMLKGAPMAEAIQKVQRIIPDYRLNANTPRWISNSNLVMFAPYHLGLLKAYKNMIGDLVSPKSTLGDRAKALDQLAAIGIWHWVVIPMLTGLAIEETKNMHAYVSEPGIGSVLDNVDKLIHGKKSFPQVLTSVITPSYGSYAAFQLLMNRNMFNGNEIYDSLNPRASDIGKFALSTLTPAQGLSDLVNAPSESLKQQALNDFMSTLGIYLPKTTPSEQNLYHMIYDEKQRYTNKVEDSLNKGDTAAANDAFSTYNTEVIKFFAQTLKEEGYEPLKQDELIQIMKPHLIAVPKEKTLEKRAASTGKSSLQKLLGQ